MIMIKKLVDNDKTDCFYARYLRLKLQISQVK